MLKSGIVFVTFCGYVIGQSLYKIGVGIGDCTGPAAEVNMVNIVLIAFKYLHACLDIKFLSQNNCSKRDPAVVFLFTMNQRKLTFHHETTDVLKVHFCDTSIVSYLM